MKTTKPTKIIYWISTGIIFLFEGVLVALTSQTEFAKEGIRHLGYPEYFGVLLAILKVAGAIVLILPMISARIKEWAYAGFAITIIAAAVSHWAVDGFGGQTIFPIVFFAILATSYITYHKLQKNTIAAVKTI
ncbi:DoxX family protein [Marivirga lumbricoides]|uniref:DoxX family protein n=1 Tax=Marivirga lumbricoides TaxID=1046115 RepID=A0A2T4DCH8_9BACT|nr:DoxX family protein [Marivirga lumbricoides]